MFYAFLVVCYVNTVGIGVCSLQKDTMGPYPTILACEARIKEIELSVTDNIESHGFAITSMKGACSNGEKQVDL